MIDYHPYQLLGHSIQKIAGAITLGELDFLLLNKQTQEIEHWEVALKYYLGRMNNLSEWFWPKSKRYLQRKTTALYPTPVSVFRGQPVPIQRKFAVMKGQLYGYQTSLRIIYSAWINTSRRLGQWELHP